MTLTLAAAFAGSSAPALMPTGNPSDRPTPQSTAPTNAAGTAGPKTNSSTPPRQMTVITRITGTRPYRSSRVGPNQRPAVIAARNVANPSVPAAALVP